MRKAVEKEIISLLNETINNNIEIMTGSYTVSEIAKEILLEYKEVKTK